MRPVFGQTRWDVIYRLWVPAWNSYDGGGDVFMNYEDALTTFDECVDSMWGQVL